MIALLASVIQLSLSLLDRELMKWEWMHWWWWWWWWWWWNVFVVWLTDERHLALFPGGTIPSLPISDTTWAGFEPAQNVSSGLVEWSCAVVMTTSPWCHNINNMYYYTYYYSQTYFLRLRWLDETSSRVLLVLIIVVTIVFFLLARYLLYPPLPLALAIEVCLAGLMLILAAPVDLVLGLTLIVANPQTPISISLKCWWFSSLKP